MEIGYQDCIRFSEKEVDLQKKCIEYLLKIGLKRNLDFFHIEKGPDKNRTHRKAISDLIIFFDKNNTIFVELKKKGGVLSESQKDYFISKFRNGFKIFVINNLDDFVKIFEELKLYKNLFYKSESFKKSYKLYLELTK